MLCKKFEELSPVEKVIYIGKLNHACQSNDSLFELGNKLIKTAEVLGLYKGVTILPENEKETEDK